MKTIKISAAEEVRDIPDLHPKLQDMVSSVISWAWDNDIDFHIHGDSIDIRFNEESGDPTSPGIKIAYRNDW